MKTIFLCLFLLGSFAGLASAQPQYKIYDLGTLGGANSLAIDINNESQVVGASQDSNGDYHAFLWDRGNISDIGVVAPFSTSVAYSINDRGVVVGAVSDDITPQAGALAFKYDSANGLNLLPSLSGDVISGAFAINRMGLIAGMSGSSGSNVSATRPVKWRKSTPVQIDFNGMVFGLNDLSHFVGSIVPGGSQFERATLWNGSASIDLGVLPYPHDQESRALKANNCGKVVGYSRRYITNDLYDQGFIWDQTTGLQGIGTIAPQPHSVAMDINDLGMIVGVSYGDQFVPFKVFFTMPNGTKYELANQLINPQNWQLVTPYAINNKGEIVGYGFFGGAARAFIARPTQTLNLPSCP